MDLKYKDPVISKKINQDIKQNIPFRKNDII